MSIARHLVPAVFALGIAASAQAQTADPHAAMTRPAIDGPEMAPPVMDDAIMVHVLLDRFEGRVGGGNSGFRWDGQGWIGTDYDKLWVKSEGFVPGSGRVEDGRHELLYGRAISTYVDLQVGVRTDQDSATGRTWAAVGVQGLAPVFINYEATVYLSDRGHAALRLAASYDLLLTQRLILQPEAELNFYSKADPGRSVGAGLSDIDAGLRLRYEISRKFAPYVGVAYVARFGQTAALARDNTGTVQVVFGVRSWF
jgi:copper resistance protein B